MNAPNTSIQIQLCNAERRAGLPLAVASSRRYWRLHLNRTIALSRYLREMPAAEAPEASVCSTAWRLNAWMKRRRLTTTRLETPSVPGLIGAHLSISARLSGRRNSSILNAYVTCEQRALHRALTDSSDISMDSRILLVYLYAPSAKLFSR